MLHLNKNVEDVHPFELRHHDKGIQVEDLHAHHLRLLGFFFGFLRLQLLRYIGTRSPLPLVHRL